MEYSSEFFYNYNQYGKIKDRSFKISDEDIKKIKSLKSYRSNESGYYDVMLQWRLSDNLDIVSGIDELSRLYVCMQFISMTANITIPTNDYNKHLLRLLYLECDDYISEVQNEDGSIDSDNENSSYITMGFKRPFGNSNVLGDVRDVINRNTPLTQEEFESNLFEREEKILLKFIDFLDDFFHKGFELEGKHFISKDENPGRRQLSKDWSYLNYKHNYLYKWNLDRMEIRNNKIEKILKNEIKTI